jgi:DNA modification methylase
MAVTNYDLFGQPVITDPLLREKFIEPPFSVLDARQGAWQQRKRKWRAIGLKGELGRNAVAIHGGTDDYRPISSKQDYNNRERYVSIFDPALTELLYHWFVPEGGRIFDPFAGGSVRGIVAHYLGFKYVGVDLNGEQLAANRVQAQEILKGGDWPRWLHGDTEEVLAGGALEGEQFDFIFSCPPYWHLEQYTDDPKDLSRLPWKAFLRAYKRIIKLSGVLVPKGAFAAFVVGEVRDKRGNYAGLVPATVQAFKQAGFAFYNECVLLTPVASASMRAEKQFRASRKLVKVHQNVLIFKKQ